LIEDVIGTIGYSKKNSVEAKSIKLDASFMKHGVAYLPNELPTRKLSKGKLFYVCVVPPLVSVTITKIWELDRPACIWDD